MKTYRGFQIPQNGNPPPTLSSKRIKGYEIILLYSEINKNEFWNGLTFLDNETLRNGNPDTFITEIVLKILTHFFSLIVPMHFKKSLVVIIFILSTLAIESRIITQFPNQLRRNICLKQFLTYWNKSFFTFLFSDEQWYWIHCESISWSWL
jgi:hypothetical protein